MIALSSDRKDVYWMIALLVLTAVAATYEFVASGMTLLDGGIYAALVAFLLLFLEVELSDLDKSRQYRREKRARETAEEERDRLQRFIATAVDSDEPAVRVRFTLEEENDHANWRNDQPETLTRMLVTDSSLNSATEGEQQ